MTGLEEEALPSRKRDDDGTVISILILIGLVVIGFFYLPKLVMRGSSTRPMSSSMLQSARQIDIMMFEYAVDHGNVYPTGKSSTEVFQKLIDEKYCSDPEVFYFKMPGKTKPTSSKLKPENICWDVTGSLGESDSDDVPMVFATGYRMTYVPGGNAVPLKASDIRIPGLAIAYKNNSAQFIKDDGLPDHVVMNVVGPSFSPAGRTYQQLTPDGPLAP